MLFGRYGVHGWNRGRRWEEVSVAAPTSGAGCTVRETWPPFVPGAALCTTRCCVGIAWSQEKEEQVTSVIGQSQAFGFVFLCWGGGGPAPHSHATTEH